MSIDARMTFDSFVVGPGNRLASAAARRAADSPAASYNPLFLYSASGLGKSHILSAMAHHSERLNPDSHVLYQTLEGYLDELADAIQRGTQEELKDRYRDLDILLLDDVQFLTGQSEAQELLLRTLDSLNLSGSQIVLASDRPPAEIDGLDARLLSRFSGGLMVDIAPPELETRVAIVRKKCEVRKATLAEGVAEQIARLPFRNVRELMGGLNRVLAAQELEGREITSEDVEKLVDIPAERPRRARRADRLASHINSDMFEAREEQWQIAIREAAEEAEAEGFATGRLRRVLDGDMEPTDPRQIVDDFHGVLDELRQIRSDLDLVGNPWPEAARGVLLDPDRVEEARALLASARERVRDFPPFPLDIGLHQLEDRYPQVAVKAARQLISEEPPEYNPLFVWSPDGHGSRMLLEAAAASCLAERPGARVAFISAKEFAAEFIDALSEGVAGAWRERWWTVELLLVHGCQELSNTERAQDEFFHLFEAVKRRGARVVLAANCSPSRIDNIDDRLRSRFEGGLVVQADVSGIPPTPIEELLKQRQTAEPETLGTDMDALDKGGEVGPDLQLRREVADEQAAEEPIDPAFDRALNALDGGSERAAWTMPVTSQTPEALTKLTLHTDDFPTLLSEREKEMARAGLKPESEEPPQDTQAPVEPSQAAPVEPAPATATQPESSGEAAAPTESAVGSPPSEAAVSPSVVQGDASSEALLPEIKPGLESAPIVTAADLDPPPPPAEPAAAQPPVQVAEPSAHTPSAAAPQVDTPSVDAQPIESPAVRAEQPAAAPTEQPGSIEEPSTPDPVGQDGPTEIQAALPALAETEQASSPAADAQPTQHPEVATPEPVAETTDGLSAAPEAALDDGAADDSQLAQQTGPWVAEALPAVLEDELDHVIDSVFAAHTQNGAAPTAEAEELPAGVAASPEPEADTDGEVAASPAEASTIQPESEPEAVATELTAPEVDAPVERVAPVVLPEYDFEHETEFASSGDSGVATRTRARRSQHVEVTDPEVAQVADAGAAPSPAIDAAPETAPAQAAPPEASDKWIPSREKTVWDWPSLEARMVVDE